MVDTENTSFYKTYFYQFRITINDTNNSTIADLADSPIHIDEPWVLFYLKNHKTLKFKMTKPSDEDIQTEQERYILEEVQKSPTSYSSTTKT